MIKTCGIVGLVAMVPGCMGLTAPRKHIDWPTHYADDHGAPRMDAGAALAAAAAVREVIRTNPHPHLFQGCVSPEQGMEVAVYDGPTSGVYYVMLEERFDRCGGPRHRVLDWWQVYAVSPQGEVLAKAPAPSWTWDDTQRLDSGP
ncbi:hypothetical protein [Melittangium boletus]|uniref:hypothetical protein n=1 Tax=Melittangium boletus TaxID=83453 RepID=UPI003DA4D73C